MPRPSSRLWLPQLSLNTLLLFFLLCAFGVGWISNRHREYLAEQKVIEDLAKSRPAGTMMIVATNGEKHWIVGDNLIPM